MVKHGLTYGLIQKITVLYLIVWTISPPLQVDTIYRLVALGCAAVWVICWLLRENPIIIEKSQFMSVVFLVFVLVVVYIEKGNVSALIKQIAYIMLVLCFIINQYYKNDWSELSGVVPLVLILLIVWNSKTIITLIEDPTIARRLVRDDETIYTYLRQGIGGYSLVYPQVCISSAIFAWVYKAFKNNKLYFIIGLLWSVSFVWLISLAGYSIAIFATVIGAILLLLYRGKSFIGAFILTIGVFLFVMYSILYVDSFRNWLLEFFDGTAVAKKINDLVSTSETGETGESIAVRIEAYSASLIDLVKYPILGSLWRSSGGGHSAFLDTFSKYGLFGIWCYAKMFYSVPSHYKRNTSSNFIVSTANATLIVMLFVSFLDSISYSFICTTLFVLPLVFEDITKWSLNEKNESVMDS